MQLSKQLRKLNVQLKDLAVIGKSNIKLTFVNPVMANSFLSNQALLDLIDFDVRIPQ